MKNRHIDNIKLKVNETFEIKIWEFFAYGQFCLFLGIVTGFYLE